MLNSVGHQHPEIFWKGPFVVFGHIESTSEPASESANMIMNRALIQAATRKGAIVEVEE